MIDQNVPQLRPMLSLFVLLTILLGGVYPALITGIGQLSMPNQANGQLITDATGLRGSALIGQQFTDPAYLWSRPSASQYDAMASGGSNLGLLNPAWIKQQQERLATLKHANPQQTQPIPPELLQASASGLDPDVSVAAARWQAPRLAAARGVPVAVIENMIDQHTQHTTLMGQSRIHVLAFNLALDQQYPRHSSPAAAHHAAP